MARLALLLALAASAALVRPGDPSLDGARVAVGTDSLAVVDISSGARLTDGLVVLETRREGDVLLRAERFAVPGAPAVAADSFALDAATLAPRGGGPDAFHPNSVDVVLAALPLADGYAARLAVHAEPGPGTEEVTIKAVRADTVRTLDGGACAAWRVDLVEDGAPAVYWIGRDRPVLVRYASPGEGVAFVRLRTCG